MQSKISHFVAEWRQMWVVVNLPVNVETHLCKWLKNAEVVSGSPLAEPSGHFLSERYDTAIVCFSKDLPFSSGVPGVPAIPFIPAKEAKNTPTLRYADH